MLAYDCATVGRGEAYFANWASKFWNSIDQVMETECFKPKTGKLLETAICQDKHDWALDPILVLAVMLIVDPYSQGSPSNATKTMIFPQLQRKGKEESTLSTGGQNQTVQKNM